MQVPKSSWLCGVATISNPNCAPTNGGSPSRLSSEVVSIKILGIRVVSASEYGSGSVANPFAVARSMPSAPASNTPKRADAG